MPKTKFPSLLQDMKGIAGIVYPDAFQVNNLIQPMLECMRHRSPHGSDLYTHKNIQIGNVGGKLTTNDKGTIYVGIDGSIQNQDVLSQELQAQGVSLHGDSSSEIVLKAYETFGISFLDKLNGDFSFFIWDKDQAKFILARDRIGKKPLYWFQSPHYFIFASELKALLATGAVPQTPSLDALSSYLYFGYIPQDMSPIDGINKLLPAHYMLFHLDGSKSILSYWSYSSYFKNTIPSHRKETIAHLDRLIDHSVKACLPKSGPIGCFISGGLGSASVAYYLKNSLPPQKLRAYTVGYRGENDADVDAARDVAAALNIPLEPFTITQENFLVDLVRIAWHLDEPIADPNVTSIWKLAEIASHRTSTVFSGMGSDELLAGHSRYTIAERGSHPLRRLLQRPQSVVVRALIFLFSWLYKPIAFQLVKFARTDPWQFDYLRHNALTDERLLSRVSPKLSGIFNPEVFLHKFHHLQRIKSTVSSYLYFDVKTRLVDSFVLQLDRLTGAFGLDWKTPYLDRELIEYLASLPEPDFLEEKEAASYLKAIVKKILPPSVVDRPKRTRQGFLKKWIESEEMKALFTLLIQGTLVDTGLISRLWLMEQIRNFGTNRCSYQVLWAILQLEIWFRLYINRPMETSAPTFSVNHLLAETA